MRIRGKLSTDAECCSFMGIATYHHQGILRSQFSRVPHARPNGLFPQRYQTTSCTFGAQPEATHARLSVQLKTFPGKKELRSEKNPLTGDSSKSSFPVPRATI